MATLVQQLASFGSGVRHPHDHFFSAGDKVCKPLMRLGVYDIDDETLCHSLMAAFPCYILGCTAQFDSLLEFEMHYNSLHRYPCCECKKQLPSAHLLDLHLSETHDSYFRALCERKPMYRCYVEVCRSTFWNPQERRSHCISEHKFPHDFWFDSHRKQKQKKPADQDMMDMDQATPPEPKPVTRFAFGRSSQGSKRMWHSQGKPPQRTDMDTDALVGDLRASLPAAEAMLE